MMQGVRIALVGPLPPPAGGMANQTEQLARLLRQEGALVEVVRVNRPYPFAWVERLCGWRALCRLLPYVIELWRALGRSQLVHVMANSGWSWHLFAAPAIWIAWLRGAPVLVNYRGGEAEDFFARSWTWIKPTLARADAVVVPSGFLEAVFARRGIGARIVPNVVDLDRFQAASTRCGEATPHVVVARNLEPIYDVPTALRAFARLCERFPQARLTVAGSGPARGDLEALANRLGVANRIRFTGRLGNAQMADLYRNADLMLNPSTVDNMPISILEALACGVPVVSTNVGGIPLLVEDGRTALLVPPGDDEALARAAARVLGDHALAQALRKAGLETVRQYTWPVVREQLLAVYADLLVDGKVAAGMQ